MHEINKESNIFEELKIFNVDSRERKKEKALFSYRGLFLFPLFCFIISVILIYCN